VTNIKRGADAVGEAARILRGGGLVAFPTETVYGLGADATQGKAVARIYEAKGRPSFNPLIVHVGGADWVNGLAVSDARFEKLAHAFWPGPLTLVMKRSASCPASELVSAGLDSIGLRCPDHPVALDILKATQRPLAAPSANLSGTVSPTTAEHVASGLGNTVDLIVDGGPCRVGLESTVLDLTRAKATILRPGFITPADIAAVIGAVDVANDDPAAPKSPGQLLSHYAPSLPVRLNAASKNPGEALLTFGPTPGDANLSATSDVREAAANLFAMMRRLDDPSRYTGIAVMPVPDTGIGLAINDRLLRAAKQT